MTTPVLVGIHIRGWFGCGCGLTLTAMVFIAGFVAGYLVGRR
jgi:hypothetical protein